jgi:hypothetical protein
MVAEREFLHPFQDEELDLRDFLEVDLFHSINSQLPIPNSHTRHRPWYQLGLLGVGSLGLGS